MTDDRWGPWREHDGGKCPIPGVKIYQFRTQDGEEQECDDSSPETWNWSHGHEGPFDGRKITHYRLRKPILPETGWMIHKDGRGWYRPEAQGYTINPTEAGRYVREEAVERSHPNGPSGPRDGMEIFHESEVVGAISSPSFDWEVEANKWEALAREAVTVLHPIFDSNVTYEGDFILIDCKGHGKAIERSRLIRAFLDRARKAGVE